MRRHISYLVLLCCLPHGIALAQADAPPTSPTEAKEHLRAAQKAADARDFARAKAELTRCIQLGLDNAEVRLLAARTARRAGDANEAEKQLEACRRQKGDEKAISLEKTLLRAQRGEVAETKTALLLLADLKKDSPDAVLILEALTRGYLETYCLSDALTCLNRWLELQPKDTQALLWRAWVHEHGAGRVSGKEWTTSVPRDVSTALDTHGEITPDALADYRRIVELDPAQAVARLRLAEGLLDRAMPQEALEHLERLQKQQPKNPAVLLALSRCRSSLGETAQAGELLQRVLTADPRNSRALAEQGRLFLTLGKAAEAEATLRKALAQTPADYQATYYLAQCLNQTGKQAEARKVIERMKQIQDDQKRFQEILQKIDHAPRDPALRLEAGRFLLRNNQETEGVRWLHLALVMDPRHRPTHQALADYYERAGKKELADKHRQLAN